MDELQNIQNLIYVIRGQRVMLDREIKGAHRRTIFLVSRQNFALQPPFVVSLPLCRNHSEKISPKFLESGKSLCTFASSIRQNKFWETQTSNNACHCKTRSLTIRIIRL